MDIFLINKSDVEHISGELLSEFQKRSISAFEKQLQHNLSYLMVDRILREVYGIENREISFEGRKPVLRNSEKCFSVSHSGEFIALAFSDCNCGVDIEQNKLRDFERIAKRMKLACNTQEEFYTEWTKYEAAYKMGEKPQIFKSFKYEDYTVSACSKNISETFEIYIQTGEEFSNVKG